MSQPPITLKLIRVHCVETSKPGQDEVYFTYGVDGQRSKRFPSAGSRTMAAGDDWNPQLVVSYQESLMIALYDGGTDHNDFLGSHTYTLDSARPQTVEVSSANGAKYRLATE